MADLQAQDTPDRGALASAFAGHVSAARAHGGGRILAAIVVAALAAGLVVGAGYLTRPVKKHPATASAMGRQPVTTMPSPAASGQQAAPAPAPGQTAPAQAAPGQAAPGQAAPGQAAPDQQASAPAAPDAGQPGAAGGAASAGKATAGLATGGAVKFTAVTGYGCAPTERAAFTEYGRWTDGLNGFISVRSGGLRTQDCNGSFDTMPMSGSTTYDDPENYALWTFHTAPVVHGTCDISLYVPASSSIEQVGGDPAVYQVFGSGGTGGEELGAFNVDQVANRGHWVTESGWPVTSATLTVKLDSYGIDWSGNTSTYAHIAVSAARLTCS